MTRRVKATRLTAGEAARPRVETLAVEEPLEIRLAGSPPQTVTTTMRLPGDDFDLALGHLVAEGLLHDPADVATMMHCTDLGPDGAPTFNVVDVRLRDGAGLRRPLEGRTEIATGACGVCGSAAIDTLQTRLLYDLDDDPSRLDSALLLAGVEAMRERQKVFAATGGVHAAAVIAPDGEVLVVREDIGRHNAVDKVLGWAAREGRLPLRGHALLVSSRAGYEIVQKAAMAGVPVLACVSAATSLAVEVAERCGLTLLAFTRPPRATVYAHPERVDQPGL